MTILSNIRHLSKSINKHCIIVFIFAIMNNKNRRIILLQILVSRLLYSGCCCFPLVASAVCLSNLVFMAYSNNELHPYIHFRGCTVTVTTVGLICCNSGNRTYLLSNLCNIPMPLCVCAWCALLLGCIPKVLSGLEYWHYTYQNLHT